MVIRRTKGKRVCVYACINDGDESRIGQLNGWTVYERNFSPESFQGPRTIEISRDKKQLFASVARARHVRWMCLPGIWARFQFQSLVYATRVELEAVRHCASNCTPKGFETRSTTLVVARRSLNRRRHFMGHQRVHIYTHTCIHT